MVVYFSIVTTSGLLAEQKELFFRYNEAGCECFGNQFSGGGCIHATFYTQK